MRLSILIPMYNAQDFIGNCIESLLNQNIPKSDYEIIIMDDGSTDNSVEVVSTYAEKFSNIKLLTDSNSGAYNTRNKLLKLAKGTYIYNLDADDYIVHNCLKELVEGAEQEDLEIIGFKTKETKSLSKVEIEKPIDKSNYSFQTGIEFLENYPLTRHELWWYFIKREFLTEHEFKFNSNQFNADVIFTLKALLEAKKVGFFNISIHRYVQTEDSIMRSKNFEVAKKRLEFMHMMIVNKSKLINFLKSNSASDVLVKNLSHRRDVFTFFNLIKLIRGPFSSNYIKKTLNELKAVNAYPMGEFNRHRYNTIQYRILRKILNTESIFYLIVSMNRLFSKSA